MKKKYIIALLSFIVISSIIFPIYNIMTQIANSTFQNEYYISTLIPQNYKNIKHISMASGKRLKAPFILL